MTSFTVKGSSVYLAGSALSDHRIDDLLTFFEAREAEAEAAAHEARKAFNDLWEARCKASDNRQDDAMRDLRIATGQVGELARVVEAEGVS